MIVEPDFFDHWKTQFLIEELDGDQCAPIYVLRLWAHCQNRKEWSFDVPVRALTAICRYQGEAEKLRVALTNSGFLRDSENGFVVVGWDEYNAQLVANWDNGQKGGRPRKPKNNPSETHRKPIQNPSGTNGKPRREEKRRVDKRREEFDDDDARDAEELDFEELRFEQAGETAYRLDRAFSKIFPNGIQGVDADWIWQHACIGELVVPGLVSDIATKVLERQITKPKAYLERTMKSECQDRGYRYAVERKRCPQRPTRVEKT